MQRFNFQSKQYYVLSQPIKMIVAVLILLLVLAFGQKMQMAIGVERLDQIQYLAEQAACPRTQVLAQQLLIQTEQISYGQYFKLLQAYQMEFTQVQQLEPIALDQQKWQ